MKSELMINKQKNIPIYRQIIEQITSLINQGVLKSGDRLPPERDLAKELNISRGTITKAYGELERNNIIKVVRGSGSFISEGQDVISKGRKERAIAIIDNTITELENMNFSYHEIKIFFDLMLVEREKQADKIRIATVDCNPEALAIFKNQIGYISNVEITRFLLDDTKKLSNVKEIFEPFRLVITTSNHYNELRKMLQGQEDKIIKAAVSPSQRTIIDIAKISENENIGIITFTERFYDIIMNTLLSFEISKEQMKSIQLNDENPLEINKFLEDKKTIIIPADSVIGKRYDKELKAFKKNGGKIIPFEYQIQRGTLIYIEEAIFNLLNQKNK